MDLARVMRRPGWGCALRWIRDDWRNARGEEHGEEGPPGFWESSALLVSSRLSVVFRVRQSTKAAGARPSGARPPPKAVPLGARHRTSAFAEACAFAKASAFAEASARQATTLRADRGPWRGRQSFGHFLHCGAAAGAAKLSVLSVGVEDPRRGGGCVLARGV
jgi:hypothetical protein